VGVSLELVDSVYVCVRDFGGWVALPEGLNDAVGLCVIVPVVDGLLRVRENEIDAIGETELDRVTDICPEKERDVDRVGRDRLSVIVHDSVGDANEEADRVGDASVAVRIPVKDSDFDSEIREDGVDVSDRILVPIDAVPLGEELFDDVIEGD
jgi:hypothetical protein